MYNEYYIKYIKQIDWTCDTNRKIAETVYSDACEYWRRVIDHIYKGNEIRADMWMDHSEKKDEIGRLDRERTKAHNKMLISVADFVDLLYRNTEFEKCEYRLDNRMQIADFIALIAFELLDITPSSTLEGGSRSFCFCLE